MTLQPTAHDAGALQRYGPAVGIAGSVVSIALVVATVGLTLVSNTFGEMLSGGGGAVLVDAAAFGLLGGLLVARRPNNPIGWLMLLISPCHALGGTIALTSSIGAGTRVLGNVPLNGSVVGG
jgi:hypothetical protein